jgi:hypothetical protein
MDEFKKYINQRAEELDLDMPREKVWQAIKQDLQPAKRNATLVYMKWAVAACVISLAGFGLYKVQDTSLKPQVASANQPKQTIDVPTTKLPTVIAKAEMPSANIEETRNKEQGTRNKEQGTRNQELRNKNQESSIKNQESRIKNQESRTKTQEPRIKNQELATANQQTTNNIQHTTGIIALNQIENTFTQIINLQKAKVNTTPLNAENPSYFNDFTIEMKRMERDEQTIKKDISKTGLTDELLDQLLNVYQQKLSMLKQLQNEINKTNNRFKQNRGPEESTKTYFLNI